MTKKRIKCYQFQKTYNFVQRFLRRKLILRITKTTDKIILGIDPGTNIMGYGLIHIKGNKMELIVMGVLRLEKVGDHALKLQKIFNKVIALIDEYKPDELAIEAPFFGKNVQSMLKLGRAQGVAIAGALSRNLPIQEYSPKKIKQSITGNGNASKEQVSAMLKTLLNFKESPEFLDATDGLAAAVCHLFQRKPGSAEKTYTGWKAFLAENPDKKG
jgi:crossover junction endodeoxyribonuclease RuvC